MRGLEPEFFAEGFHAKARLGKKQIHK
jgi:hypothetical protein